MSFIKRGDGKILSVYEEDELTEQQKKAVRARTENLKKNSNKNTTNNDVNKKLEG